MIITWTGDANFVVKTKNNAIKSVKIGDEIVLGDLEIKSPGEYESGGVQVEVFDGFVKIFSEKITVTWTKKAKVLNDQDLERLDGINIFLIGVGGGEFSETKTAIDVIRQVEPQVVIPMYKDNLDEFLKEQEATPETMDQYKFDLNDLSGEETKIVVLNATK